MNPAILSFGTFALDLTSESLSACPTRHLEARRGRGMTKLTDREVVAVALNGIAITS